MGIQAVISLTSNFSFALTILNLIVWESFAFGSFYFFSKIKADITGKKLIGDSAPNPYFFFAQQFRCKMIMWVKMHLWKSGAALKRKLGKTLCKNPACIENKNITHRKYQSLSSKEMTKRKFLRFIILSSYANRISHNVFWSFRVCTVILCVVLAWTRYRSMLALASPY